MFHFSRGLYLYTLTLKHFSREICIQESVTAGIRPICSVAGAEIDLLDRESDDYNWNFRYNFYALYGDKRKINQLNNLPSSSYINQQYAIST